MLGTKLSTRVPLLFWFSEFKKNEMNKYGTLQASPNSRTSSTTGEFGLLLTHLCPCQAMSFSWCISWIVNLFSIFSGCMIAACCYTTCGIHSKNIYSNLMLCISNLLSHSSIMFTYLNRFSWRKLELPSIFPDFPSENWSLYSLCSCIHKFVIVVLALQLTWYSFRYRLACLVYNTINSKVEEISWWLLALYKQWIYH